MGTAGQPPKSYIDLNRRLTYLQKASKHLEHLIKERTTRSSFVSHVGSSFLGDDKAVSNQEIPTGKLKQHLNTVNLQIDVTSFLNSKPTDSGGGVPTTKPSPNAPIPTLFGNGKERTELIVSVSFLLESINNNEISHNLYEKVHFSLKALTYVRKLFKIFLHIFFYCFFSAYNAFS